MSDNKIEHHYNGIGFGGMLTIVFITLKLTGYIDWSWWWVLAPIWMPITILLGIVMFILFVALLAKCIDELKK